MPRGGRREGAGRPRGSGRFGEPARNLRVPFSLVGAVSALLAEHQQSALPLKRPRGKRSSVELDRLQVPDPGNALVVGPLDAETVLNSLATQGVKASVVMLDPWYRTKSARGRAVFLTEAIALIEAASRVAPHIFVWGFPESVARLVDHWSPDLRLEAWLTWFFKNAASRSKSWRPSQQACLHICRRDAKLFPEHFYSERHRAHAAANRLEFKMTPYSVIEAGLLSGFLKRSEQTGYPSQKPESVIEPLLRMTTQPGSLVIDPTAGSGTTGVVALRLGCAAILSDRSATALKVMRKRLNNPRPRARTLSS